MSDVLEFETITEVAHAFRCGERKIAKVATEHGIGINLHGRAGWRFSPADRLALQEAMRPVKKVAPRRRRRSS